MNPPPTASPSPSLDPTTLAATVRATLDAVRTTWTRPRRSKRPTAIPPSP